MAVRIGDKIKQLNNNAFFLMDACDVEWANGVSIQDYINALITKMDTDYTAIIDGLVERIEQLESKLDSTMIADYDDNTLIVQNSVPIDEDGVVDLSRFTNVSYSDNTLIIQANNSNKLVSTVVEDSLEFGNNIPISDDGILDLSIFSGVSLSEDGILEL